MNTHKKGIFKSIRIPMCASMLMKEMKGEKKKKERKKKHQENEKEKKQGRKEGSHLGEKKAELLHKPVGS